MAAKERNEINQNIGRLDRIKYKMAHPRDGDTHVRRDRAWLIAEVERLQVATTWRPIGTAPRNGTEVLLCVEKRAGMPGKMLVGHYMPGGHCIGDHPPINEGWYFWNGCMFDRASKPIRWMPLPEAAEAAGGE